MAKQYDIFLSFKHLGPDGKPTRDSMLAKAIYQYLSARNLSVFLSTIELEAEGISNYMEAIGAALETSKVLIVVGTSTENLKSKWVCFEWESFTNDIISEVKPDGRVFSYIDGITVKSLPAALRHYQAITHGEGSLERLYRFITNALNAGAVSDSVSARSESDSVLELLGQLLGAPRAPRVEGDIDQAIAEGITGIDAVVKNAVAAKRHLTIKDVDDIIAEAIGHGAGIYNAGSYFGCASIYHHAAKRALEYLPDTSPVEQGLPKKGTRLAAEWLALIVRDSPEVDDATADDLAWELRFVFDSIRLISIFDKISVALAMAGSATGKPDVYSICNVIEEIIAASKNVGENHVRAYLLRHTAKVILEVIDRSGGSAPLQGAIRNWYRSLQQVVEANPHITRYNSQSLTNQLLEILPALKNGNFNRGSRGKWYDPRSWFGNS